jgi:hypothetical protein
MAGESTNKVGDSALNLAILWIKNAGQILDMFAVNYAKRHNTRVRTKSGELADQTATPATGNQRQEAYLRNFAFLVAWRFEDGIF